MPMAPADALTVSGSRLFSREQEPNCSSRCGRIPARGGYLNARCPAPRTREAAVLRPYSVSTPMMATMISGGTPYDALALISCLVFQPEAHAAVDAAVVQGSAAGSVPTSVAVASGGLISCRTLAFGRVPANWPSRGIGIEAVALLKVAGKVDYGGSSAKLAAGAAAWPGWCNSQ